MTWVSASSTLNNSSSLLLIAGGGGGTANDNAGSSVNGGLGGGLSGTSINPPFTGGGATQSAGGIAGNDSGSNGNSGSIDQGAMGVSFGSGVSGGGGGGLYGGGSGAVGGSGASASGGGGSGYISSGFTSTSTATGTNNGNGNLTISYTITGSTQFSTSTAALYVGGHIFTGNQNDATTTISSCGTSPLLEGNDTVGTIIVGSGIVTSCKLNFGAPFTNPPITTLGVYGTTVTAGITSETTSSVTFGFSASLGGGQFNYINLDESN
jgi:hypothetical protein